MNSSGELTTYMNGAVERLITNVLKSTLKNPKETAYLMEVRNVVRKASKKRIESEEKGIHIPTFLISSITNSCNLFCRGCYARENKICTDTKQGKVLTDQRWLTLFREAADCGITFNLLAGGEPLLRKELIDQAAKIKDMIFPIFTNGLMIDRNYMDLFNKNRNLIPVISLEGGLQATDSRRGEGVYEKIVKIMQELKRIKILFGTSITVTSENVEEVTSPEFINLLEEKGARMVFFIEYVPVTPGTDHLALSDAGRSYLEQRQTILRKDFENTIFLSFPGDEKYMGGCLAAGRGFFHINPYGAAEPCPFSPYSDCNLAEVSFLEALQSPLFKKLGAAALIGGEHSGGCALFEHEAEVKALIG